MPVLEYFYVLGSDPEIFPISNYNQEPKCGRSASSVTGKLVYPNDFV